MSRQREIATGCYREADLQMAQQEGRHVILVNEVIDGVGF